MDRSMITDNMNIGEIIEVLTNGNYDALFIARDMILDSDLFLYAFFLDSIDIRGEQLVKLYKDCCSSDKYIFIRTLEMFKNKKYSLIEINNNLEEDDAIPFVDCSLELEGFPSIKETFNSKDDRWDEYCDIQIQCFREKRNIKNKNGKIIKFDNYINKVRLLK